MNSQFEQWHNDLDKNTNDFENKFNNLTSEQLNWKPNEKSWSIGQVIEHLIKSSEGYFAIPEQIRSKDFKPSFLTNFGFVPKLIGNLILKSVKPDAKRKVKTMKIFEPSLSNIDSNILQNFRESQQQLHNFIDENKELILSRAVIPSPVNKHFIYHFDTVIDILVNHQKRHFEQACNVLEMMKNENK